MQQQNQHHEVNGADPEMKSQDLRNSQNEEIKEMGSLQFEKKESITGFSSLRLSEKLKGTKRLREIQKQQNTNIFCRVWQKFRKVMR